MRDATNEGIQMSGGRIDAGALAVGRGARAVQGRDPHADPARAEINSRLEELLRRLDADAGRLENPEEVRDATQVVANELGKDRPNKTTITGVLTGIAAAVASVSGLATATDALLESVQSFL
ncbi:DUF5955 family protein [Pseudonocardia cypriaca]|uniref:Uncharacterized protein n=1 Tax=Pseudonocardia cypriaca TaxID=882449 RepID=A0A543FVI5_9PSEU|nr:DUF5955 family protein [Pseudonocardia cypriaca]TQM37823.1 hypothetical protein FB388_5042 [Pseudonocardia cypriaca]